MSEILKADELKEKLFKEKKNGYYRINKEEIQTLNEFNEGYKKFLDNGRTERLCVKETIRLAKEKGFTQFDPSKKYNAGDKVYVNHREKAVILCVIGSDPLIGGIRIAAAHIDSPRIDLKPNPVYEADELALFKTHYYGGIKKYQWAAIPLVLYGVLINSKGEKIEIALDQPNDPRFVITDLLPHLAQNQMQRKLAEGIKGEELNVLIGSCPFLEDETSESVKLNILNILYEKYGIVEGDFMSAELELVPDFKAYDLGFDRSLVGGYGQDDRVCAYPALIATLDAQNPQKTILTLLADKEEIGSTGNTGMQSAFFENFVKDLAKHENIKAYEVLRNSQCLSADVNAAFDPTFPDVMERNNSSFINKGVVITKYTGSRGKSGTSDASAEYMGFIRNMLNENGVIWQTGELGKVDQGGGGTVAMFIAHYDVDTVDLGVPVLAMHAPFEIVSKLDVYMAYKAICTFYNK